MEAYLGKIKSKQQAMALAAKLDAKPGAKARGAASLLRRNWRAVAARPAVVLDMIALADNETEEKCDN